MEYAIGIDLNTGVSYVYGICGSIPSNDGRDRPWRRTSGQT